MFTISKAQILTGKGTDKVLLHTDIKEGCYPFSGNLTLEFVCAQGTAKYYIKRNMPEITKIEVIRI